MTMTAVAKTETKAKTKPLRYKREAIEIDDLIDFNPDEPEAQIEAMLQNPVILYDIMAVLNQHFVDGGRNPEEVFLDTDTILCYDRSNLNVRVQPDCYVAFGVDAQAIRDRGIYLPWEAGKPPDFALEVASDSTANYDTSDKMDVYREIGVPELWLCDSTGGELYGQPLAGWRLSDGEYLPISITAEPDGVISGYSAALGLHLCWDGLRLRFRDLLTGEYLRNTKEFHDAMESERIAHAGTRQRLGRERIAHAETQQALERERRAREAERERTRRLEEELRRLRGAE